MFGLPQQTKAQALADLTNIIKLEPEHISWYQLTIEPNTAFYTCKPQLPDDDAVWQLQLEGIQKLRESGYQRYEISAYSQSKPCAHNLNYWRFGDYLGIGAGAHGKLTLIDKHKIVRTRKHRLPKHYMKKSMDGSCCVEIRELSVGDTIFEFLLNTLRLTDGFAKDLFNRTGHHHTLLEQTASSLYS